MAETLVLLPGWGMGPAAMEPLALALQAAMPGVHTAIEPLPLTEGVGEALAVLDSKLPAGAWLLGWSLGGMLATAVAAKRGHACPGLMTLASNACFVARPGWPEAMAAHTFDAFTALCATAPATALKRFSLLCAQGSPDARTLAKSLTPTTTRDADRAGLALLGALDNRATLANLTVPHLHLFASKDALVPVLAAEALAQIAPRAQIRLLEGSHALALEACATVASEVMAFMEGAR